jgi:hypothetical protein
VALEDSSRAEFLPEFECCAVSTVSVVLADDWPSERTLYVVKILLYKYLRHIFIFPTENPAELGSAEACRRISTTKREDEARRSRKIEDRSQK